MKKITKIICVAFALMLCLSQFAGAYYSYKTYTYDIDGNYMQSPDAYVPSEVVDSASIGLKTDLNNPADIDVDSKNNLYIADTGNNRIVVLNNRFKLRFVIESFTNDQGVKDTFSAPEGVFVNDDYIYVCDTTNSRIVLFDKEGNFKKIISAPESSEIQADDLYQPKAVAVDASGRMYIVSKTTPQGIIAMDADGKFQGFIGAQKTTISAWAVFWRKFQTDEQRAGSETYVATEYENITIDWQGCVYVTTTSIEDSSVLSAINGKSKTGEYAPVKKLNTQGDEILARNGFWPPSGEVKVRTSTSSTNSISGPSKLVDVALGPENTWSIIDSKRSKIYTYDSDGRLLFIFGDTGGQLGNMDQVKAIAYMGNEILVLDNSSDNDSITVFKRTEYGNILISAIANQTALNYEQAASDWEEILMRNNNFDEAYVGIGKTNYREGNYEGAMDMYESAYDTTNYSNAFKQARKGWVAKYAIWIPVIVVVVVLALYFFFKYVGKRNKEVAVRLNGKRTYWEEVIYGFHVIMHPFDGYWDLKHERRGSVRGALTWLVIAIATFSYNAIGTAYLFNPYGGYLNIFGQIISLIVPLLLWVISNWCLTTLFEGEGSFKDIFIASCYALVPIPLVMIPSTLLTNVFSLSEAQIVTMLAAIMWVWVGILIFFGSQVTHDYSLGKNMLTSVGSIVGMAFIMFIVLLFSSLVQKIVGFISSIVVEISYRL